MYPPVRDNAARDNAAAPSLPPEWEAGVAALRGLPDGGVAFLVGETDRGKTTFAALAARTLAAEFGERTVAVVDADVGQSEIGPPGVVGGAWATPGMAKLHDLRPAAQFFVGALNPALAALELVAATAQGVAWARKHGAKRTLVDTTGFVAGPAARRLKVAKAQAVGPHLILALARGPELDPLLAVLGAATGARVLALPVPETVGRKPPALRQTRRLTRLSQALDGSRELALTVARPGEWAASGVALVGATLGTGEPVAQHLTLWAANALRLPVVYAEIADGTLTLFLAADGPAPRAGWETLTAPVATHFNARSVRTLSLAAYADVLVGLHDETGRLLSIGRFLRLDADRGEIVVSAPKPAPEDAAERVRLVTLGRARVRADGSSGPDAKAGEL